MNTAPAPILADQDRADLVASRIERLRALLERIGARAILLESRRDFAWLTLGGLNHILYTTETGVAPVLVTPDEAIVIAPVNEFARVAEEEVHGLPLTLESTPWWEPDAARARASQIVGTSSRLIKAADAADELQTLRSQLTRVEHERMAWLATLVLAIADAALADVEPGTLEDEVVARAAAAFAEAGVRLPVVLTASDDRILRYRHPIPKTVPIEKRLMLIVVAECWGLHVAHTQFRELVDRDPDIDDRAAKLAHVLTAMRNATVVGRTFGEVFAATREAYAQAGLSDEWMLHHQGGSIGYQARERIATPDDTTPITAGMAFAWNPSAPGFKREETLYLAESGAQHVLITTPG